MTQEMRTVDCNELSYLARKPFNLNTMVRDNRNEHFIRHPEEQMLLDKSDLTPKEKPLRGYLDRDDFE